MRQSALSRGRSNRDIETCLTDDVLAAVLHIEGAEAIDANFALLDVLYAAGLRSIGPVGAGRMRSATVCALLRRSCVGGDFV
jgi:microsomal dipeptidase-like Zn-dependent dipeptidase